MKDSALLSWEQPTTFTLDLRPAPQEGACVWHQTGQQSKTTHRSKALGREPITIILLSECNIKVTAKDYCYRHVHPSTFIREASFAVDGNYHGDPQLIKAQRKREMGCLYHTFSSHGSGIITEEGAERLEEP